MDIFVKNFSPKNKKGKKSSDIEEIKIVTKNGAEILITPTFEGGVLIETKHGRADKIVKNTAKNLENKRFKHILVEVSN